MVNKPIRRTAFLIFTFIAIIFSHTSFADTGILLRFKPKQAVSEINFKNPSQIQIQENGTARIRGTYKLFENGWTLLCNGLKIEKEKSAQAGKNSFTITVKAENEKTPFEIQAISPHGKIEKETIILHIPTKGQNGSSHAIVASLGPTLIFHNESDATEKIGMSAAALTLKAAYQYLPKSKNWDFAANSFVTLLPLQSRFNGITDDTRTRFLGVNARIGFPMPFIKNPWRLSVLAGLYYTTMFVNNNALGFKNMSGPQLFPMLRRTLTPQQWVFGYFKFSPVASGLRLNFMRLENREIAAGSGWVKALKNGKAISVMIDISKLSLNFEDSLRGSVSIISTSYTLSAGISI
ncbi:MAG: hypothetical protein AABZ06_10450 [Bdellovibrionota bacterium]